MQILQAYSRHISLIVPLFDQYRQFYGKPPDSSGARLFLADRLERRDSVIYMATDGEGSSEAGVAFAQLYPSFSSVETRRIWILNDLYVMPAWRRQGVAKGLMDRARHLALETKASRIILATEADNRIAQAVYDRLGFRKDERFLHYELAVTPD
ncbi:MAG: GNAT family N-acetyltransferase [Bryobacteraceae bacterium]